ncbi:MAG: SDR family oxidoreductase [Pseudomonadota bacterium]
MFAPGLFEGERILVTGGGTGLGRAMATRLLELGADIVICGRRKNVLDETADAMMSEHGGTVDTHTLDIRNAAMVDEVVGEIFAQGTLTGLINNAAGNFIARTEDISPKGFDAVANIVMHGTFYVTHAVGSRWIKAGSGGSVVSILTTWVRNGGPFTVPSAMSKGALDVMTKSLATEWGRYGIRLNAIAPGEIPTEGMNKRLMPGMEPGERTRRINPMGRTGSLEEIQNLAAFLMSKGAPWISGETIALDGAQALAAGGSFYELRDWGDAEWQAAREAIQSTDAKDRQNR